MSSVIYKLEDHKGRFYIGSTISYKKRQNSHFCDLRKNIHCCPKLQSVYNKYGKGVFFFEIVEHVENTLLLIEREQHYIDTLKPWFNVAQKASSPLGVKHSEATKLAHSIRRTGKAIHDEAFKERLSERNKSRIWSEESKKKNRDSKIGGKHSAEHCEKISKANKGKILSSEHKIKIGAAQKGRIIPETTKIAVANANRTRVWSAESIRKQVLASTGRIYSEESKLKQKETFKQTILKRKSLEYANTTN